MGCGWWTPALGPSNGIGTTPTAEPGNFTPQHALSNIIAPNALITVEEQRFPGSRRAPTLTMQPTQALQVLRYRRIPITTKDVGRGFYKGNRTGSMGRHTKYGGYIIEWNKVRTYVVPKNLKESKVSCPPSLRPRADAWANSWDVAIPLCESRDQGRRRRLQGPAKGTPRPLLLRRAVETIQRS